MKVIITTYPDNHAEVVVRDTNGFNLHCYTFDTKQEAKAFWSGFQTAKTVANGLIQSMPIGFELVQSK